MNPPPPPQVVYVERPRKTSGCAWLTLILCVIVGGCFVKTLPEMTKAVDKLEAEERDKGRALQALEIVEFKWNKTGFGSVMSADFKVRNNGPKDLKDIEIECVHTAPSGTVIDRNKRTIYEIVKAGETREFKDFNMGFVHSQASKSTARITNATPIP